MTNLTEQWKKGELPEDFYYVISDSEFIKICYVKQDSTDYIELICSKVPSYKQWQAKLEENTKLKELLKECELWFTGVVGNMNDKNVGEHNRNVPIGNFEYVFKVFSQKINQVLGEE